MAMPISSVDYIITTILHTAIQLMLHLNIQITRAFPGIFLAVTAAFPDCMKSLQPIFNSVVVLTMNY